MVTLENSPDLDSAKLGAFMERAVKDVGDPIGAAQHVLSTLKPEGTWMSVEPFANDLLEQTHNPIGRIDYSTSTLICTPASLAQETRTALGAQAGEERIRSVVMGAGITRFRRAAQTQFNLVFEARPSKRGEAL